MWLVDNFEQILQERKSPVILIVGAHLNEVVNAAWEGKFDIGLRSFASY